ncbi:hypothetical protein DL95DRAFT_391180 [Leptodontidium sp. 2 PMI_412]|nr:hypothetical protein DL95DRAFT_391180 [Leptodontidium sp. 2 PMI_412]
MSTPAVGTGPISNGDHWQLSSLFAGTHVAGDIDTPQPGVSTNLPRIASQPLTSKRPKVPKSRIRCSYPGCKLTFPRNYELQRHRDGVHNSKVAVFCPFYECDRAVKPYPRKDKAWEHMRKHRNGQQFLCIFDNCRSGPWSQEELLSHLKSQHIQGPCCTESEAIALGFFQWRQTPLRDGLFLFESKDNCPLAFLGCEFKADDNFHQHLTSHELMDRSKGYEAIQAVPNSSDFVLGTATCPICREQVCGPDDYIRQFTKHLEHHSKEERGVHAFELAEIFRPYLSRQRSWGYWGYPGADFGIMMEAELQEAGLVPELIG